MDRASPTPFTVIAQSDSQAILYGFIDATDPNGLVNLFATSSFAVLPQATDMQSLVRLSASVYRKLKPYEPDLGQVFGIEEDEDVPPDPWPATSDDTKTFKVTLNISSSMELLASSPTGLLCSADGTPGVYVINGDKNCRKNFASANFIVHPALMSYQATVQEEYYPFDDADAVQTLFTYLPYLPEFIVPALAALPVLLTKLARRFPGIGAALNACR